MKNKQKPNAFWLVERLFGGVKSPGLPPGSMVYVGAPKTDKIAVTARQFDAERHEEFELSVDEIERFERKPGCVLWLDVIGVHDVKTLRAIGGRFDIHPLTLEDIAHTGQRPKGENHGSYIFIVLKSLSAKEKIGELDPDQVCLVLGQGFVLSFQESNDGLLDPLRERIKDPKMRVRKMGSDYLAYTLLDVAVDNYFIVAEKIGDRLEELEETLQDADGEERALTEIRKLKGENAILRRSVWPLKDALIRRELWENPLIADSTRIYLNDVIDHVQHVSEIADTFREMLSEALNFHMSAVSNRMNQTMKALTVMAGVFIPLTFIAGVYGMNFKHMPELGWVWGYPFSLAIMALTGGTILYYYWKKGWL